MPSVHHSPASREIVLGSFDSSDSSHLAHPSASHCIVEP